MNITKPRRPRLPNGDNLRQAVKWWIELGDAAGRGRSTERRAQFLTWLDADRSNRTAYKYVLDTIDFAEGVFE